MVGSRTIPGEHCGRIHAPVFWSIIPYMFQQAGDESVAPLTDLRKLPAVKDPSAVAIKR